MNLVVGPNPARPGSDLDHGVRSAIVHMFLLEHQGSTRASIMQKVLERCAWVDRGYEKGPCLEWQGPTSGAPGRGRKTGRGHSYPRMQLMGSTCAVHRVVYTTLHGYIPARKQLDHLCKNRLCVVHCEPVTHKQNQKRRDKSRA